jgi:predicted DNA-binding transcriptional regulator AlpA
MTIDNKLKAQIDIIFERARLDALSLIASKEEQPPPEPEKSLTGEDWLTAAALSKVIGKSVSSIYRDARMGVIPSHKIGGAVKFLLSEVTVKTSRQTPRAA